MRERLSITHARDGSVSIHRGNRPVANLGGPDGLPKALRKLGVGPDEQCIVQTASGRDWHTTASDYLGESA